MSFLLLHIVRILPFFYLFFIAIFFLIYYYTGILDNLKKLYSQVSNLRFEATIIEKIG